MGKIIHFALYGWSHSKCGELVLDVTTVTKQDQATCWKCLTWT